MPAGGGGGGLLGRGGVRESAREEGEYDLQLLQRVIHMFDGFKALSRVRQLEEDFRELKRRMELMEVAWTDTLDRFKAIMGRIEKRAARAETAGSGPSVVEDTSNGTLLGLTSKQQEINARILARRNRLQLAKPQEGN
jgi:hypothetical protein